MLFCVLGHAGRHSSLKLSPAGQLAARFSHHISTTLWQRGISDCPTVGLGITNRAAFAASSYYEGVFMRRSWTALAVALSAAIAAVGCNDYGNTFQVPTGANISSLSPANITAGSPQFTLTVNGQGFVANTVVQWNGGTIPTQLQTDSSGNVLGVTATVAASLVAKAGTAFVN